MAQDDSVFRSAATRQLVRDLEFALTRKDSVVVLAGASGTGKTTIASDALRTISTRLAFACIMHPPLTGDELLEQLLTEFGFEPGHMSRVERLQLWRQFLSEMCATDTRVCLLVENAESLEIEVLLTLHQLTAADAALCPGANVILTTTAAAESLLTQPDLMGFSQRIRLRRRMVPLNEAEVREYLEFKCGYGGAAMRDVFADDLAPALYDLSGGIIRVVDNLLETTLMTAVAEGQRPVAAALLMHVAESHFGLSPLSSADVHELLLETAAVEPIGALPAEASDPLAAMAAAGLPDDVIPTLIDCVDSPAPLRQIRR